MSVTRKIYCPITGVYQRISMPNRLANESSPYLLQHAENPVEWFPWGEEALKKAKAENKPIFLSVGYSACHWCHVMEHESFENQVIAQFLNEHFVSIKVDREERPDLDQLYMHAVMALQRGQGGWPLSAFLTPDCHVFFGGTYWPPHDSRGMPGFDRVLRSVLDAFENRRDQVNEQSGKITDYLNSMSSESTPEGDLEFDQRTRLQIGESLERIFDFQNGGFGRAPKFPHPMSLQVLMRLFHHDCRESKDKKPEESGWIRMVTINLEKMALGGIYDHLAGGFARYSVDEKWLVPHFEKMLYDNALLTDAYLDAFSITRNQLFQQRATETFDYLLNDMTDPEGPFHSTEDADSEGEEGKFYVWSPAEIIDVLGDEAGALFCDVYDVTNGGNFEGKNILNLRRPIDEVAKERNDPQLAETLKGYRSQLLVERNKRVRPGKDDKVLVSWNALMIHSLAKGALILDNPEYLKAALNAAEFIEQKMVQPDGVRLFHTWRHGAAKVNGFLDDYAYWIYSLVTLFECSGDSKWLDRAKELVEHVVEDFHDEQSGGFFFTGKSSEQLVARTKEFQDSSVPSGNAMMVCALTRLYRLTGNQDYRQLAEKAAAVAKPLIDRAPSAAGQMICGLDQLISPFQEIIVFCDEDQRHSVLHSILCDYHPNRVIVCVITGRTPPPVTPSLLEGKEKQENQPTVYVCQNYSCKAPLVGEKQINEFFGAASS